MPRLSSSRGSGSSKSKPQQWTFVTEDPGKPKHFNHAGRTSEEDAVPRAGESPGTNVVARGAPSPSSGALPRQWAPIGNSASAFSSGERGNVASSLRPSNPPHHPSRQQARPHSQPERPESAGEAYAPSSAASDSGEEHADDTANGHTSDSSLPPSQGTRLRSSERLRKRGRDDPPSSESPLQPLSVDGDGDDASEPELQVVKAEDDVRPKKRTYVRRDAQRRKEQNAQAQKKFRWKKKAMAEQMSKDLLDHKRKNKELEARCAELIELANDKDQQLTNKETLLGRLRNENGTLKRRLEVMNRRFGFDHDDEASGPSSS
ncbi:hypothetical protein Q8F55_004408 [Vanrija albida]|uniref:BZIP domain-containing protein n=1 Tax=Vanrija albida TaxID=181172 RepID=A0ABR3Q6U7_9TREE